MNRGTHRVEGQGREATGGYQAPAWPGGRPFRIAAPRHAGRGLLLGLLLGLAGCIGMPDEGPIEAWRSLTGDPLDGRPLPPGAELPYPNLASVPPAPARGAASTREELSAALAAARDQANQPLPRDRPLPQRPAGSESGDLVPAAPPAPPRLAAAPAVRWDTPDLPNPGAAPAPGGAVLPADPGSAAPPPPPAEMMAPAPPPADMLAPPARP